jgi:hypothetical protein
MNPTGRTYYISYELLLDWMKRTNEEITYINITAQDDKKSIRIETKAIE